MDVDHDGLDAATEIALGTDPALRDTDGDGVNDGVESFFGSAPLDPDARPHDLPMIERRPPPLLAAARGSQGWELTIWDRRSPRVPIPLLRPNGPDPFGLAVDQHGLVYAATGFELLQIEPFTGEVEKRLPLRDAIGAPVFVIDLAFEPHSASLYGVERDPAAGLGPGTQIVRIDLGRGLVTRVGAPLPRPIRALSFAWDPAHAALHEGRLLVAFDGVLDPTDLFESPLDALHAGVATLESIGSVWWLVDGLAHEADLWTASGAIGPGSGAIAGEPYGYVELPRSLGDLALGPPCPAPCLGFVNPTEFVGDFYFGVANAYADLDADGDEDVVSAVPDAVASSIRLFRNDGHGVYVRTAAFTAGRGVSSLVLADFDRDGSLDLGFTDVQELSIALGDGAGGFGAARSVATIPGAFYPLVAGDVTGDGAPDLLGAGPAALHLFINDGSGGFAVATPLAESAVRGLDHIALVDGGAASRDVVASFGGRLRMLRADGGGAFSTVLDRTIAETVVGIAKGDVDGDALEDVAIAIGDADPRIEIYLGAARGALIPLVERLREFPSSAPLIADVTGDGLADLAFGAADRLVVRAGDGAGRFVCVPSRIETWDAATELRLSDFDEDGSFDVGVFGMSMVTWQRILTPWVPLD